MNIVITSGGTSEYIDTVRKITNSSSGKLGAIIAKTLYDAGNEIWYIHSQKAIMPDIEYENYHAVTITGTMDLKKAVEDVLSENKIDWFIHSMAVSDYVVQSVTTAELLSENLKKKGVTELNIINNTNVLNRLDKISSDEESLVLTLKKAPKIIGLIKQLSPDTKLIGFKLLSHVTPRELNLAAAKLRDKNSCEFVIANDLTQISATQHHALFVGKDGIFDKAETKEEIAVKLKDIIISH